ncbi:MAG: PAS domain-containing protein [Microscillaceae bacterium]|nr:PAS domain-containing protein [Microscillaceae bacterium]
MQVAQKEIQGRLDFYAQIDALALLVNHDYQIVNFNEKARAIFKEWRFSLQPEYLLLDVFPQTKFFAWKNYLDRALRGESLTFTQVLIHRATRKPQVFAVSLRPLLTEIQEVTHIFVSIQALGDFMQHLKTHHRQYIRRLRNRYQWRIKNIEKEHQLSLEESKAYLDSSQAQLQLREEIIALLEQHAEALVFRIDYEWCFTHYSHQIKHLFGRWRFYIQPEYYLPDVFPMVYFLEWKQLLRRACRGEAIQTKALILNRAEKRFYLFQVEITPEADEKGQVHHLVFKVLDQSGLLKAYRQQRKAEKHA